MSQLKFLKKELLEVLCNNLHVEHPFLRNQKISQETAISLNPSTQIYGRQEKLDKSVV